MTYHARSMGAETESSPETARWYKLTPAVISYLTSAYPADSGVRAMIARVATDGLVFAGFTADDLYYLTSRSTGNIGGSYREPIGITPMTYAQVLAVFDVASGGPDTKPIAQGPYAPVSVPETSPAAPSSKLGLYVAIVLGSLATIGTGVVAYRHFKGVR